MITDEEIKRAAEKYSKRDSYNIQNDALGKMSNFVLTQREIDFYEGVLWYKERQKEIDNEEREIRDKLSLELLDSATKKAKSIHKSEGKLNKIKIKLS